MDTKSIAESYFARIGDGHEHAISMPNIDSPKGRSVDRILRRLIENANNSGDCIINVGNGIYRPIPGDPVDDSEFREYIMKDLSRKHSVEQKIYSMQFAYEARRSEIQYAKQQAEGSKGGKRTRGNPAQLRLPGM